MAIYSAGLSNQLTWDIKYNMDNIRILYAEDDISYQGILGGKLEHLPVQLTCVVTYKKALELIRQGNELMNPNIREQLRQKPAFDIVITDVHLQDTDTRIKVMSWQRQDGYDVADEAVRCGIQHVIIASNTDSPYRVVQGAEMCSNKDKGIARVVEVVEQLCLSGKEKAPMAS